MIKQVIIWSLQDKCFGPNLDDIKNNIKVSFESLEGKVPGLVSVEVQSDCLSSSNGDILLSTVYEDDLNLKGRDSNEFWNEAMNRAVVPFIAETKHVEFAI